MLSRLPFVGLVSGACALLSSGVGAEQCPADQPQWLQGRFTVFEPNLDPPALRGIGEVFVYAYEPGDSTAGTRFIAVSDPEGYFCIHDTTAGTWVITTFEPFVYRPLVREIRCTASRCDAGEMRLDQGLRVSDDYVDYDGSWFGGPFAQTLTVPEEAVSLVKITFRSGSATTQQLQVRPGGSASAPPLASAWFEIPPNGGRGTAVFQPGAAAVSPGEQVTLHATDSWAPWRLATDPYDGGEMYQVDNGNLMPIAGTDLAFNLDIDGPDGNLTSFLVLGTDGAISGSTLAQSFVARSSFITHASVFTGPPDGLRRMRAFISASSDGPPIGPVKETQGLQQQGVAFGWLDGEVPVTPGQMYYLHIEYPDGPYNTYTRTLDPGGHDNYPSGQLQNDGAPASGHVWGRIMGPARSAAGGGGAAAVGAGGAGGAASGSGGAANTSGAGGASSGSGGGSQDEGGCGCHIVAHDNNGWSWLSWLALAAFGLRWRRRH